MKSPGVFPIITIITLSIAGTAAAQEPSQSPRFLTDVVGQFNALAQRPDAMGFELHGPDPSQCQHMQAVARVDAADGTPYLLVTRNGNTSFTCPGRGSEHANMYIVKMGSRDKDGERMRSNRLRRNSETTDTPPETTDRVVRTILFDGTTEWPHYDHPGGMQQIGDIVVLALEAGQGGQPSTKILFLDVRDPENPAALPRPFLPPTEKAGVVGITPCGSGREGEGLPCPTGHYLMLITGGHNEEMLFFESTTSDLTSKDLDWKLMYTWHKDELIGSSWPDNHQTLHFLRQEDGRLFLAGARSVGTVEGYFGDDYIDLYEVGINGSKVELTHRSTRHMISHPTGEGIYDPARQEVLYGGRLASFAAASSFHITPKGELLFYATEHDNDGPEGSNGRGSVKAGEWRHIDMFRPGSPAVLPNLTAPDAVTLDEGSSISVSATAAPPIAKPWIELFEYFNYGGRFVVVEHPDFFKDNFDEFGALDKGWLFDLTRFDNLAASWRWFAPEPCSMRANQHSFDDSSFPGARSRTLFGTGVRQSDRNLENVTPDSGSGDMFQVVSSVQFSDSCSEYYSTPLVVRWDLDFDGSKETTATTVTMSAARLDGPSDRALAIETRHPTDGLTATKNIAVHILNVSPVVGSWALLDAAGRRIGVDVPFALQNRPVSGVATFTDQGRLDHQTAMVEWGDGSTTQTFTEFTDAFDGATGRLVAKHPYSVPGSYNALVAVTDDDGGSGMASAAVSVLSPADAVKQAIALLDALIATAPDQARIHLIAARAALAGAGKSGEASGALEKIDRELVVAAAARLKVASQHLDRVAELVDIAIIRAIVDEVAAALVP
jgi:hypothetical protein